MEPTSGSHSSHMHDQEAGKFILDGDETSTATEVPPGPLPESYGENRLVIMARDPLCIFAYWDATPERLAELRQQAGLEAWQKGQAILRVYDMTGISGDLSQALSSFDVDVSFDARRWYVHVPAPGRSYQMELGFRLPDGRFLAVVGSNRITLPRGAVSTETDSRWMIVNVKVWEKMFETTDHFGRGSADIAKMMAQRWEFLRSVFSGSSSTLSSGAWVKEEPKR